MSKDNRETYTNDELNLARSLRKCGASWLQIGRKLGRRNGDGIRRRLDPEYRERRNIYMAKWHREARA